MPASAPDESSRRILVVDDEESIRLTVHTALSDAGFLVKAASGGDEALTLLEGDPGFWLMLLDLKMPGTGGMAVLRTVRERGSGPHVAIITAHGTVENAVEAMKLGATDFVQKPFSAKEIRSFVERLMRREDLDAAEADNYEAHLELARRAISHHEMDEAQQHVRKALNHDGERPEAHNLMGVLYESQGDRRDAQNSYRRALELDDGYEAARVNLRRSTDPTERDGSFMLEEAKRADVIDTDHRENPNDA